MNAFPFTRTALHNQPNPTSDRGLSILAWLLALCGAGMTLATFSLWWRNGTNVELGDSLSGLGDLLMALACCVVAGLILTYRPRHRIGWLLLSIGLLWAIEWFGEAYSRYAYTTLGQDLPAAALLQWLSSLTWVPGFCLVIWLILLFPTGRPLSPRWGWIGLAATILTVPVQVLFGIISWPLRGPQLLALLYDESLPPINEANQHYFALINSPIGVVLPLAFLLLIPATIALFLRLRRARGVERQQVKWFAYAVSLLAGIMVLLALALFVTEATGYPTTAVSTLWEIFYTIVPSLLPLSIGVAILRHRLWDIDLIIRRTLVYSLLTGVVIGVYVLIVAGLGTLLTGAPVAGAPEQPSGAGQTLPLQLMAAGAVAVIFQPVRQQLQQRINRLFYGEIDEPYTVVARLGQQLETTLAPEKVLTTIVDTVRMALKLPYVGLRLANGELPAQSGQERGWEDGGMGDLASASPLVSLPLIHQGDRVGDLLLAPRLGEDSFSAADQRLLEGLAHQAGAAIQAVRLTADLQQSRQRLVATREEERRRLRRDLHDALGAALASIAMQADAARSLVDEAPEESKLLLHDLTDQAQTTLADIRRLIYNLRPPALDDLGLIVAVRQLTLNHAQSGVQITLRAPEQLPTLPAAVEVAAYRIVQEALTNVVRHAQAQRCIVRIAYGTKADVTHWSSALRTAAAALKVEISDDGVGINSQRKTGVGTHSMHERAEELGGSISISARPEGGTRVAALLPIETETMLSSKNNGENREIGD